MSIDEKAFHAAWEAVGWDTQNPHAETGQRRFIAAYEASRSEREIVDVKPGTLPINIDEALEALHTQYQFCGDAIIARRSPDAPTDTQLGRIRAAHLNIIPILKALKAAWSKIDEQGRRGSNREEWAADHVRWTREHYGDKAANDIAAIYAAAEGIED